MSLNGHGCLSRYQHSKNIYQGSVCTLRNAIVPFNLCFFIYNANVDCSHGHTHIGLRFSSNESAVFPIHDGLVITVLSRNNTTHACALGRGHNRSVFVPVLHLVSCSHENKIEVLRIVPLFTTMFYHSTYRNGMVLYEPILLC